MAGANTGERTLFVWLPVALGAGALVYLSLTFEPPLMASVLPLAPAVWAAHHSWRRRYRGWPIVVLLPVFVFGFGWMQLYTHLNPVTMLAKEQRIGEVTGRIIEISDVSKGYRITLDDVVVEALSPEQTPQCIRLKLRGDGEGLMTGQRISVRAGLLPPTGPVMPGGFDFARYFYFQGIGAVGYAIPPVSILNKAYQGGFWLWLTRQREAMSERIRAQMSQPEGAVAAALMTGDRAAIPEEVNQVMRDTNLSHILAISGMHMALVTGLLFFALRWLLAVLPQARYLRSPKKLAALIALAAGLAYLFIAGLPISACRAFIMVGLVFSAILLDRQVMPMRSLAIAALALLLINPSYAMQPGFQLSFIATAALIAWYERVRCSAEDWFAPEERTKRIWLYLGGVLMTSLVAELATAPLVLYHFNSLSLYGLLANLIIMPIVSFWMMPFIVVAFILWLPGLEGLALIPVEWGIGAMITVARWVAAMPGAHYYLPAPPGWGMAACMAGLLWLMLQQGKSRYGGLAAIALGLCSALLPREPDLLISADARQVAGRVEGELVMLKGRARSFLPEQWAHGTGQRELAAVSKNSHAWRCSVMGCIYRHANHVIAFPDSFAAQAEDCRRADMVVTPFYLSSHKCDATVIDRRARERSGSHWLWLQKSNLSTASTYTLQGDRSWSAQ